MSATARAEARRKAILARGNDRLSKLTQSAREGSPVYMHDDPPLPSMSTSFMGEDSTANMPKPRGTTPTPPGSAVDPSVWSEEQQAQFMSAMNHAPPPMNASAGLLPPAEDPFAAMMAAMSQGGAGGPNPLAAMMASMNQQQQEQPQAIGAGAQGEDPLAALMASMGGPQGGPPMPGSPMAGAKPKSMLQKVLPFVHLLSVWTLLAYFAFWVEPRAFEGVGLQSVWERWAGLGGEPGWLTVQFVPFFWAFGALQIGLHSLRIFSGYDKINPPFLLSMALPHLPPLVRAVIVNGLKYMQMGSLFVDDLAGLVLGVGLLVGVAKLVIQYS